MSAIILNKWRRDGERLVREAVVATVEPTGHEDWHRVTIEDATGLEIYEDVQGEESALDAADRLLRENGYATPAR